MVSAEKSRSKLKKFDSCSIILQIFLRVFDFFSWQRGIALTEQDQQPDKIL